MPITEEWRPVAGFEGVYEVSNQGRIKSLARDIPRTGSWYRAATIERHAEHILKCSPDDNGYPLANLYRDGKRTGVRVHTLVAEAFVGPCPKGQEVAHEDGHPKNCAAHNLRYDTRRGNLADKVRHGTRTAGERHSRAKLTQDQVDQMRAMRARGMLHREIAPHFGVHKMHVGQILRGGRWNP